MQLFFKNIAIFLFFSLLAISTLVIVDRYIYDRIGNDYLAEVLISKKVNNNIFLGSSKLKWSIIDSLIDNSTVLADGGQFTYSTIAALEVLKEQNLIRGKRIFLDLNEADEIKAGFGKWWSFSEAFVEYRYASILDYSPTEWPSLMARIIKDLTHFTPNQQAKFHWQPLETVKGYEKRLTDSNTIITKQNNYKSCATNFTMQYENTLLRTSIIFNKLEQEFECKIYIILTPYPTNGCLSNYERIFGSERIIDLASVPYEVTDFHDNSHLNVVGAQKFTMALISKMDSLSAWNYQKSTIN